MKKLLFAILLSPVWLLAQPKEGQIVYQEVVKMTLQLPEDAPEEVKKMIPPTQKNQQTLLFNEDETLYRSLSPEEEEDIEINHNDGEGAEIKIKMGRPQNQLYRDWENDRVVESREFMGRFFLIKDAPHAYKWKLSGEKKKILDYECQKAVLQDSSAKVEAWFTPAIPVSAGPDTYAGLPGLILELDIDGGARHYSATKVELKKLEKGILQAPSKGKSCTRAEYQKTVDEKLKEMNAEGGSGGMQVIIRNND